jgi:hypothetical protein
MYLGPQFLRIGQRVITVVESEVESSLSGVLTVFERSVVIDPSRRCVVRLLLSMVVPLGVTVRSLVDVVVDGATIG